MANTPTALIGLQKPAVGDTGWGTTINANFDSIDSYLGGSSALPALLSKLLTVSGMTPDFGNTQTNSYLTALVGSISLTEFHTVQSHFATSSITGAIDVPTGATEYQVNAVVGLVTSASTAVNAVGGYFSARATANGVKLWGINPLVQVDTFTGVTAIGCEIDCNVNTTNVGTLNGLQISGVFSQQPASGANAIIVNAPIGGNLWNLAFVSQPGAAQVGALFGAQALGNSQFAQRIQFNGTDSGGVARASIVQGGPNGDLYLSTTTGKTVIISASLPAFTTNALAVSGGLSAGCLYRNGADPDMVCIVH